MKQSPREDVWAAGDLYEPYVGRWSREVAREFLDWLAVPAGMDWLDVGCGTGALTQAILDHAGPKHVRSVDASSGYVEYAKAHVTAGPASFEVGDAQALPVNTESVDAAVTGLMLNFVPQPQRALTELSRATRHGRSTFPPGFATSMTIGRRSWAGRVPRRAMPFRSTSRAGPPSRSGFDRNCPSLKTARSS